MSEPKFTPAPWWVEFVKDGAFSLSARIKQGGICICQRNPLPVDYIEQGNANAHLIAAAPEMYEALEEIMEEQRALQDERACCLHRRKADEIEALLKKARGEAW